MAGVVNVLVCVCGLAVDIKAECAVRIVNDCDIQHGNPAVLLNFPCPFDVWVHGVDVIVEWLYVVIVDGYECVVGFPQLSILCSVSFFLAFFPSSSSLSLPLPYPFLSFSCHFFA